MNWVAYVVDGMSLRVIGTFQATDVMVALTAARNANRHGGCIGVIKEGVELPSLERRRELVDPQWQFRGMTARKRYHAGMMSALLKRQGRKRRVETWME